MPPVMIVLNVMLVGWVLFGIISAVAVSVIYKKMFGSRFSHDPLVTTYTAEGQGLESKPVEIDLKGEKIRGAIYTDKEKKGG